MKQVYIGQVVPVQQLNGDQVGSLQMFYYQNQNQKNFFGVSNEGKCVKPAICKQVIILNENLFAWESDNGTKEIQLDPLTFCYKRFYRFSCL